MLQNLFEIIRNFNFLIQESSIDSDLPALICDELSSFSNSTVLLVDYYGKVIYKKGYDCSSFFPTFRKTAEGEIIESQLNDQLKHITNYKENIALSNFYIKIPNPKSHYMTLIFALKTPAQRLSTLLLYKSEGKYSPDEISAAELSAAILTLVIKQAKTEESILEIRNSSIVKSVIDSLSFSELKAILHVFNELDSMEGTVIASKIADKAGITRSVIVNSLRKLESAGVIESHSLGMKGTHIKVLNDLLPIELNKISR